MHMFWKTKLYKSSAVVSIGNPVRRAKKNILKAKNRRNILSIVLTEQNFSMELNEYIF